MLRLRRLSEIYNMKVFTDSGDYFGDIEEAILSSNKVTAWKVKAARNSIITKVLGNAKGVIVPQNLVKAIGGIMLVSNAAVPNSSGSEDTISASEDDSSE